MKYFYLFALCLLVTPKNINAQNKPVNQPNSQKPFVLGLVDDLPSKILSENRVLNIYLPEGYDPNDTTKYATNYLLDGSVDEDFIHIVGLVQYSCFPWVGSIPKSIVVGIANVDRRRDFYFPTTIAFDKSVSPTSGGSAKFIDFLEKELQPYIDKKYKTSSVKTLIGQSAGGMLATQVLFQKPYLFNKYIIVSPSLWWDNGSILKTTPEVLAETYKLKTEVYIGVGKEGLAPCKDAHVMEVDANILADKLKSANNSNLKVYFDYMPQENHGTSLHPAVFNAFRLLYKDDK